MTGRAGSTDVAGWIGVYPFRGIRTSSLDDLSARAESLGIGRVVVGSFEGLFWENGLDAIDLWRERLAGRDLLEHWPVVNPSMPGQLRRLERLIETYRPRGLRILPNYHGYQLSDPCVARLTDLAAAAGMVVQLFQRIADERWHWMLRVPPVEGDQIDGFLGRLGDEARVLISAHRQIASLSGHFERMRRLFVDVSRVRGPVFAIERLPAAVPGDRLVFGSLWPIQIIEATLWQVELADISEEARGGILRDNFATMVAPD